jgi:hypothetical protein
MSNILFIDNDYDAHHEILESIIVKYKELIGNIDIDKIYLFIREKTVVSVIIFQKNIAISFSADRLPTLTTYVLRCTLKIITLLNKKT